MQEVKTTDYPDLGMLKEESDEAYDRRRKTEQALIEHFRAEREEQLTAMMNDRLMQLTEQHDEVELVKREYYSEAQKLLQEFEQRLMGKVKDQLDKAHQKLALTGSCTVSIMYAETLTLKVEDDE